MKTKYKHKGDRAFSRADPKLWNDLPQSVQSAKSLKGHSMNETDDMKCQYE